MTRMQILKCYAVDKRGIIRSAGKFEGEMLYAPYFYELAIGDWGEPIFHPDDGRDLIRMHLSLGSEDYYAFPELDHNTIRVLVYEDDQGFVHIEEEKRPIPL